MTVTGNATELFSYEENLGAIKKKIKTALLAATPTGQKNVANKGKSCHNSVPD